jgi:hypothetical protein
VVAAIDPVAYEETFKHGKMVVTVDQSVKHHLRELVKLGQLFPKEDEKEEFPSDELRSFRHLVAEPMQLLTEWAEWEPSRIPFLLNADQKNIEESARSVVSFASWSEAIASHDFGRPGDKRLHLGLLPQPYIGDLRHASIYVLLLNPGLAPTDYYGEYEVHEYRNALLANLKQQFDPTIPPFIFLDPRYSWHGGFRWWHGKLSQVIDQLAVCWGVSFSSARASLARKLASIELLPYHSSVFSDPNDWLQNLRSVALAKAFVNNFVFPRVEQGKAIVIVLRKAAFWDLPRNSGVIPYGKEHARGAHLTPDSPGGQAILRQLASSQNDQ